MKIVIWGAGHVGRATAYRFASLDFVSEIAWINRSFDKVQTRCVDIGHGLALSPSCHRVVPYPEDAAVDALKGADIAIITAGSPVNKNQTRADVYAQNAKETFSSKVCPALKEFLGIVINVSNPVDLLARLIMVESGLPQERVLGLGTVVETARLRASLAGYLNGVPPAREVQAYAIGTHDPDFVPVILPHCYIGQHLNDDWIASFRDTIKHEVASAAQRVKSDGIATLHPIVESIVAIARAVVFDTRTILTVSTLDPLDPDKLFYSLPCSVGKNGVASRHDQILEDPNIKAELQIGIEKMRETLKAASC